MRFYFHRITGGIILIAVGFIIWFSNLGVIHVAWRRDWPVILIVIGIIGLVKHIFKK
jgi:hypothetical protein